MKPEEHLASVINDKIDLSRHWNSIQDRDFPGWKDVLYQSAESPEYLEPLRQRVALTQPNYSIQSIPTEI